MNQSCLDCEFLMNVVLLQDGVSPWSMNFVKPAIKKAIEYDTEVNYRNSRFFFSLYMIMNSRSLDILYNFKVSEQIGYT